MTASAQAVDNKTTRWLAGTVEFGQSQQAFMLFDAQTNRLMAYTVTPMKELELVAVDVGLDREAVDPDLRALRIDGAFEQDDGGGGAGDNGGGGGGGAAAIRG